MTDWTKWKLVPVNVTPEMIEAGRVQQEKWPFDVAAIFRAMLAAAPPAPVVEVTDEQWQEPVAVVTDEMSPFPVPVAFQTRMPNIGTKLYAHPLALREPTEDECRRIANEFLILGGPDELAGRVMFNAVREVMTK